MIKIIIFYFPLNKKNRIGYWGKISGDEVLGIRWLRHDCSKEIYRYVTLMCELIEFVLLCNNGVSLFCREPLPTHMDVKESLLSFKYFIFITLLLIYSNF